jgi:folate-binding protein YgfZ
VHGRIPGSDTCLIRLPDADSVARYLWAAPAEQWATQERILAAALPQHPATTWDWLAIRAGEPSITAATQEKFVPQMINFELLGGVDFKKGCYPGQEIVARSQYLGKVKRRMIRAHLPAPVLVNTADNNTTAHVMAGVDVFSRTDPTQPCGMIVNAAAVPVSNGAAAEIDCLVEIRLEALPQETAEIPCIASGIHTQSPDGPELTVDTLLYQAA